MNTLFKKAAALAFASFFVVTAKTHAAALLIVPEKTALQRQDELRLNVLLDPQNQDINATEGDLLLPPGAELVRVEDGGSIVPFWTEQPAMIAGQPASFHWSGIIPGGFTGVLSPFYSGGRPGTLFSVILRVDGPGMLAFNTTNSRTLLNDGTAAETKTTEGQATIQVTDAIGGAVVAPLSDSLPESFVPEITKAAGAFGPWILVFRSEDPGMGVDHYEVREGNGPWVVANSPYELKDQTLGSTISVKAINRAGRERVAEIPARNPSPWYASPWIGGVAILAIIIVLQATIKLRSPPTP